MGKRKRNGADMGGGEKKAVKSDDLRLAETETVVVQIVTGSYERILHGLTATVVRSAESDDEEEVGPTVEFADTFLFTAHSSSIRCLAHSPLPSKAEGDGHRKVILASGSSDERIHLYHVSVDPPSAQSRVAVGVKLTDRAVLENPKNRELGVLLHHASAVTALHFRPKGSCCPPPRITPSP